jgi:hypothetical protein
MWARRRPLAASPLSVADEVSGARLPLDSTSAKWRTGAGKRPRRKPLRVELLSDKPFAELLRLSRSRVADELNVERGRAVLGN